MKDYVKWLLGGLIMSAAGVAMAHGPKLDYVDNTLRIVNAEEFSNGIGIYDGELAFNFANLGWQALKSTEGGGHLLIGDLIGLQAVDLQTIPSLNLSSPTYFLYDDGSQLADPGAASLAILGSTAVISKSSVNFASLPIGEVDDPETFHEHLGVLLTGSSTGLYAFYIRNDTSNPSIAPSNPYFLILNNGLSDEQLAGALGRIDAAIVPESSSLLLIAAAGGGTLLYQQRQRRSRKNRNLSNDTAQ